MNTRSSLLACGFAHCVCSGIPDTLHYFNTWFVAIQEAPLLLRLAYSHYVYQFLQDLRISHFSRFLVLFNFRFLQWNLHNGFSEIAGGRPWFYRFGGRGVH